MQTDRHLSEMLPWLIPALSVKSKLGVEAGGVLRVKAFPRIPPTPPWAHFAAAEPPGYLLIPCTRHLL